MATQNQQHGTRERSLVVRAAWYVFVGWWATGLWLSVAWLLNLSVVGLPLGIKMINKVPKVLTLKAEANSGLVDRRAGSDQPSLVVRAAYFVFVGWWASGVWMGAAYLVSLTVVGLPLAIVMYNKLPYVTSLYRY
ncbi:MULTISPECIES: YccF domain-containing protein [Halorussus]|uniref:YccF domain-containing protein n=1 Tax=Halorussus TaxID=1070314 RepID=UPI000E20CCF2|nr:MULTISPECIES: YccF domain-containing protein [Halorussus]NHN59227.1 YccF domain-containing protein [Halorussus sp. JP-T4]